MFAALRSRRKAPWGLASVPPPGALELDPTDTKSKTLVAGIGRVSSYARLGGARNGLLRTKNRGNKWTAINGGATWTQMDLPGTIEDGFFIGIHPGGQASIHMSISADPTDANIVYMGGDRQPFFGEASGGPGFFPNSIGAENFSGRHFRGDASKPSGSQWVHLTHSNSLGAPGGGTASNSSPHADSRDSAFNAAGELIEVDDGGIYKRSAPRSDIGDWFSLNGDLAVTEHHNGSYDSFSEVSFSGNQDNGTTFQSVPSATIWELLLSGDGGDVQIDDSGTGGISTRFSSAQGLQAFNRTFWDAANNFVGFTFPPLTVIGGGAPIAPQFTTPVQVNAVEPERLLIGAANSLYESLDQGDTVTEEGPGIFAVGIGRQPLAYGHPDNPDVIYSGNLDSIAVRTGPPGSGLTARPSFPGTGTGLTIRGISIDPEDFETAYVANSNNVFVSTDVGVTWTDLTGDLAAKALFPNRALVYVPRGPDEGDLLVIGTSNGVFYAKSNQGFAKWKQLGSGLPVVGAYDLEYDAAADVLSAATLGRGTWQIANFVNGD